MKLTSISNITYYPVVILNSGGLGVGVKKVMQSAREHVEFEQKFWGAEAAHGARWSLEKNIFQSLLCNQPPQNFVV